MLMALKLKNLEILIKEIVMDKKNLLLLILVKLIKAGKWANIFLQLSLMTKKGFYFNFRRC